MVKLVRYGHRGLSLFAHYTYAHAMTGTEREPAGSGRRLQRRIRNQQPGRAPLGRGDGDLLRRRGSLRGFAGHIGNGWMAPGIGNSAAGCPNTMRVSGSLPEEIQTALARSAAPLWVYARA